MVVTFAYGKICYLPYYKRVIMNLAHALHLILSNLKGDAAKQVQVWMRITIQRWPCGYGY